MVMLIDNLVEQIWIVILFNAKSLFHESRIDPILPTDLL